MSEGLRGMCLPRRAFEPLCHPSYEGFLCRLHLKSRFAVYDKVSNHSSAIPCASHSERLPLTMVCKRVLRFDPEYSFKGLLDPCRFAKCAAMVGRLLSQ